MWVCIKTTSKTEASSSNLSVTSLFLYCKFSSPKATAHYHYLSLICSASSDQRNTPVWQQCSPLEDRHYVAVCPTLRPLSCYWAKPMEPQSVISPAKPNYAPSKPKPMTWGVLHIQRWFRMLVEKTWGWGCSQRALSCAHSGSRWILIFNCPSLIYTHPCHHHKSRIARSEGGLPGLKSNKVTVMQTGVPTRALQISFTPTGPYYIMIPWT